MSFSCSRLKHHLDAVEQDPNFQDLFQTDQTQGSTLGPLPCHVHQQFIDNLASGTLHLNSYNFASSQ